MVGLAGGRAGRFTSVVLGAVLAEIYWVVKSSHVVRWRSSRRSQGVGVYTVRKMVLERYTVHEEILLFIDLYITL